MSRKFPGNFREKSGKTPPPPQNLKKSTGKSPVIGPVILRRSQEKAYNLCISHVQQILGGTLSIPSRGMWPQIQANPKNFEKCPGDMWERSPGYLGRSNLQVKNQQKSCPSRVWGGPPQPDRKQKQKKTWITAGRPDRKSALCCVPCYFH